MAGCHFGAIGGANLLRARIWANSENRARLSISRFIWLDRAARGAEDEGQPAYHEQR